MQNTKIEVLFTPINVKVLECIIIAALQNTKLIFIDQGSTHRDLWFLSDLFVCWVCKSFFNLSSLSIFDEAWVAL